jgi:hypothetical protein
MNTPELKNPFTNAHVSGENIDPETYHAMAGERGEPTYVMGRGALMEFSRCPMRWRMGYVSPESESKTWGTMLDAAALTPARFQAQFVAQPETYPAQANHQKVKKGTISEGDPLPWNNNATYCADWCELQVGKTIIRHADAINVEAAVARLHGDEIIHDLFRCSKKQVQVTGEYHDQETGIVVPVKSLIDLLPSAHNVTWGKCVADLKTTTSAGQKAFKRTLFMYGYHVQAAWYLDLYVAATGEDRTDFLNVVQESFPPFQPGRRLISSELVELGRSDYIGALRDYCQCLKTGTWPDYERGDRVINGFSAVELEAWMINS